MTNIDKGSSYRPTFAQREGIEEIPPELAPKSISIGAANLLWHVVNQSIEASTKRGTMDTYIAAPWWTILRDWMVRQGGRSDKISISGATVKAHVAPLFMGGAAYHHPLGFIDFVLQHALCPANFAAQVQSALIEGRMGYRVAADKQLYPIFSEAEAATVTQALDDLASTPYAGANTHLVSSAQNLFAGDYAGSIRESIHAIESVASILAGKSKSGLGAALNILEAKGVIHGALKEGFRALYWWTSDEKGVRHSLLEDGDANVDVTDAAFMLGASAAFVSYLINKGRNAGLLPATS
ncbi:hypothetical protein [Aestuariivirga litoralis]|uniref:hypothetical protein n=1 Tax=Aestuariivirga litoralis TaxID=2650924 RepID=UPI0018C4F703|nr:hypothetical protein [Aestuariivirga litoralis]MBG1230890.1 hypothetical protein [Aestuariivirga litoralis]